MHEIGLCQGILDATLRRARGRRVVRVRVRAGVLQHLTQDSVDAAFGLLAEGTSAEGATVQLVQVPAQLACRSCGHEVQIDRPMLLCPGCGRDTIVVNGGDDVILESIEFAAATASQVEGG
jgi:hydrogenase nickel incorporation protein HypA/HybF